MRSVQQPQIDLNLLRALALLLEERHIARAADRFSLSPSAMSRTLARLRRAFGDELLVPTANGYELTPRARQIEAELAPILERLRCLVVPNPFDPAAATDSLRIHATDYACNVLLPDIFAAVSRDAPHLELTVEPLTARSFDQVQRGQVDLALTPVAPPPTLRLTRLYEEEYVGVVSVDHPVRGDRLVLDDLRHWPYVRVVALPQQVMVADQRLHDLSVDPPSVLQVPYFSAALAALPGTVFIALIPGRLAQQHAYDARLRIVRAPREFIPFAYGMIWHPRSSTYPAHAWIRSLIVATGIRLGEL